MNADCGGMVEWHGCYSGSYDIWCPDAYSHPAKMSVFLCHRIFDHLEELGLLKAGGTILDPMGGIGTTGLVAASRGYSAILIELEPKFVDLIQKNIDHLSKKLNRPLDITILQGDARNLSGLLEEKGLVGIVSPPYSDSHQQNSTVGAGQSNIMDNWKTQAKGAYSDNPSNIGNLPDKPLKAVVSPPYGDTAGHEGTGFDIGKVKRPRSAQGRVNSQKDGIFYGTTEGQIGSLPDRIVSVTSPPYEDSEIVPANQTVRAEGLSLTYGPHIGYGQSEGQLGQEKGESYLEAMAQVYAEIGLVADVLAVVVKNPTRNGKLRRLDLDTIALLEATGWEIKCHHHALLFEEQEQAHLFDGVQKKVKGRMSFFKRLSWQKGSPVAAWENVIIAVREGGGLKAVMSPPFEESGPITGGAAKRERDFGHIGNWGNNYGDTPGQIGKLK